MEELLHLDQQLFIQINSVWTSTLFERIMPLVRDKLTWLPVYVFILSFVLLNNRGLKALMIILLVGGTVGLSDTISSKVIKPGVERLRPCNDTQLETVVIERVRCGGGYSFTSSHASNHFALSMILFLLIGNRSRWRYLLFLWAGLIAYAQVYVGVHYPIDVIVGGIIGMLLSLSFYQVWKRTSFSKLL